MSQQGAVVFYEETVFSKLIDYYQIEEDYESALRVVDNALKQHCFSAFLYYKKAQLLSILCHDSSMDQAWNAIERAESISPMDLPISILKAQLLIKQQFYSEAFALLDHIKGSISLDQSIDLAEVLFCEGLLYEQMEDYDMMYAKWSEALLLHTRHPEILSRIWTCIKRSNGFKECLQLFNAIIDKDPYCHLAWFYLGHGLSYQNRYKEAIEAYEYAFIIDNSFEEAYKECAANCLILRDYAKALECYQEALLFIKQPDADLLFNVGQCYHYQGNREVALSFYHKAIDIDRYYDEVYYHIGKCLIEQGEWQKAIGFLKRAIGFDNRQEDYFAALGAAYYHLEQFDKAYICYSEAADLCPEQPAFWLEFATFLLNIRCVEEAASVLEDAEEFSCGSELLYCKAVCLYQLGRKNESVAALAEALEENFEEHKLLLNLSPEFVEDPKIAAVINYFQKA